MWSRPATGNPPNAIHPINGPHGGGLAIYVHPSRSHMLYLHAGLVPPMHYLAGYLMQCSLLPISQGGAVISKPYTDHVYASDKSTISDTKTPTYSVPTGP